MEARAVLIMSHDALAAALLGALAEAEGHAPHFARGDESPRDALRRVRPGAVVVDCDVGDEDAAALIGPARMMGARVVLFGRPAIAGRVAACAEQFGVPVLAVLPAPGELARLLGDAER